MSVFDWNCILFTHQRSSLFIHHYSYSLFNYIIFSICFFLVRVVVDPDPISGTLGATRGKNPGRDAGPFQCTIHKLIHT